MKAEKAEKPERTFYIPKPREVDLRSANDEDPYRTSKKPPEPTSCTKCHASFQHGKWTWDRAPKDSYETICPACNRIEDKFPAGYVLLKKSDFLAENRKEIVAMITDLEKTEKAARPLQRIMAIEDVREGLQVTTTDSQLARGIAETIHEAFKGDMKLRYSRDENLLRATWKR
jgi:NMD protein affecting ribosome stability and mRNA decay